MCFRFSVPKIFVFCVKLCLLLSILLSFFLLNKTFCSFLFSGTYLYQVCQTYDKPLHLDFQLKHQYQPKLISLILPKCLRKLTLKFYLILHCSVDHAVLKQFGLTDIFSMFFPVLHIYTLTSHFSSCRFLMAVPLKLKMSSLRKLIRLTILTSTFFIWSWLFMTSCCFFPLVL